MNLSGPMLEILSGDLTGRRYRVEDAEFVIGRAPTCDLVLPKRYISREHARITRDGPEYVIDGLSGLNPVLLGDRPARPRSRLSDGDEFELCKVRFRFRTAGDADPPKRRPKRPAQRRFDDLDDAPDERGRADTHDRARSSDPGGLRFDDGPDDDAVSARPKSGSRAESAESQNERTAELGKLKDSNDPDYDPFAEVDTRKKKKQSPDAGRDKALKLLVVVGALGIVLAGGILRELNRKEPFEYVDSTSTIKVALNETIRFEEPWSKVDPPSGRAATPRDGEPYVFHRDDVVEVEWAVPHIQTKCVFLIRGVELGETRFELTFPESRRIKVFTVVVEGDDPHDTARDARKVALRARAPRELRQVALEHLGSGDTYTKEREVASREGNYRLALAEYSHAVDAAVTLRDVLAREGTVPGDVTELVRRAEDAENQARSDHEGFVARALAVYRAALDREPKRECVEHLERSLRAINRDCDPRSRRLRLILEEVWGETWTGEGTEGCGDH